MKDIGEIWLTPQDIADILHVHVETIRRWLRKGMIPAIKLRKNFRTQWRIRKTDFDNWLEKQFYASQNSR